MKVSFEFPKIEINEKWLDDGELPQLLGQESLTTRTRLISAFQSGVDANGEKLRDYSPAYAKQKLEKTGNTVPNLTVTGELARSIDVKTPKRLDEPADIYFKGTHKGGFANSGLAQSLYQKGFRGWIQWGRADIDRIGKSISKLLDRKLKNFIDVKP